mmetsp:Transcript_53864/g.87186  ORF Transcript_53864/g.87186 Transcript_53864/m.87186 type:complete len:93 (-) Transcript_53864:184-462(-)
MWRIECADIRHRVCRHGTSSGTSSVQTCGIQCAALLAHPVCTHLPHISLGLEHIECAHMYTSTSSAHTCTAHLVCGMHIECAHMYRTSHDVR